MLQTPHTHKLEDMSTPPLIKVQDGVTYTIVERRPISDQFKYYWLGDNGEELELTWEEFRSYCL